MSKGIKRKLTEESVYAMIGLRVRSRREWLGKSQGELAESAQLTRTSIVSFEAGRQRIPIHVLWRIAIALGGSVEQFVKGI